MIYMIDYIKLLRPHHYIKNLFIFAPLFFSFSFTLENLTAAGTAFVLFSLVASSIYALNDLVDIEEDRQHPEKRNRPLANGKVSTKSAKALIVLLAGVSFISAFFYSFDLFLVLLIYFILNVAYSFKLKHITIVDIFIIATGFVLRLFAGSVVIDTTLSMWIIIITFILALFLAVAKRRDDVILASSGNDTRKNIDGYNLEFVNAVMVFMSGVIVMAYIMYTVSEQVIERLDTQYLFLTTFFVILGIMRYMQLTFVEENSGNPTKIVLKDRFLQINIILWLCSYFLVVTL